MKIGPWLGDRWIKIRATMKPHTCKNILLLPLASTKLIILVMDGLFLCMIGMGLFRLGRCIVVQRVWLSEEGNGFNGQ